MTYIPNRNAFDLDDFALFITGATLDPGRSMEECKGEYAALQLGYQQKQRELLAKVYAISFILIGDRKKSEAFLQSCSFFRNQQRKSRFGQEQSILAAVATEVMAATSKKRTLRYVKALTFMLEVKARPNVVFKLLSRHGIEVLIRLEQKFSALLKKKRERQKVSNASGSEPVPDTDWDSEDADMALPTREKNQRPKKRDRGSSSLMVEVSDNDLTRILSLPTDSEVDLRIRMGSSEDNWLPAVAISISIDHG